MKPHVFFNNSLKFEFFGKPQEVLHIIVEILISFPQQYRVKINGSENGTATRSGS